MLCPKCQTELMVDSVIKDGDTTRYIYVCVNPKCEDYKKASTVMGEEKTATIK